MPKTALDSRPPLPHRYDERCPANPASKDPSATEYYSAEAWNCVCPGIPTPGPWVAIEYFDSRPPRVAVFQARDDGTASATCVADVKYGKQQNGTSTANLIAAAPEMFDALSAILMDEEDITPEMRQHIEKVLNKAEGR